MINSLLSLSTLPVLLFTSPNSWSTSLNLLFFYITWSTLVFSHPPLKIELIGTLIVRVLFFWLPSILFLLFDTALPSISKNIKIQGSRSLRRTSHSLRLKVLGWSLFNTLLGIAVQGAVEYVFTRGFQTKNAKSALRITSTLPMPGELVWDVIRGLGVREIAQYYVHRFILHDRRNRLAVWHNGWQHALKAPWSAVAQYDHPVVHVVGRVLPCYLPAVFLRFHLLTWLLYVAIVSVEEATTFSGYSTVYSMLGGATKRTDKHFKTRGEGNFALWGLLDFVHGTSIGNDINDNGIHIQDNDMYIKDNGMYINDDSKNVLDEYEEKKMRRRIRRRRSRYRADRY